MTVSGDVLEQLVDDVLPRELGGTPGDFQFAEDDVDGQGVLVVRVHPSVGQMEDRQILRVVTGELQRREMGRLAAGVWNPAGAIRVERVPPRQARSGKTLAFEPLGQGDSSSLTATTTG
jgi:hypothetical protein